MHIALPLRRPAPPLPYHCSTGGFFHVLDQPPSMCQHWSWMCVQECPLSLTLSLFLSVSLSDSLWLSQQPLAQPPDCGPFSDSPLGGIAYQPLCKPLLSPHAPTLGAGDWGFALYDPSHKSNPPGLAPIRNSSTAPGPPPRHHPYCLGV